MKAPVFWSPVRPQSEEQAPPLALAIGRAIWENSPILVAIDISIAVAVLPALLLAGFGGLVAAPVVLAITLGPIWIAAMVASEAILTGEAVNVFRFASMVRASARSGVAIALVPGAVASVLLGTLSLAGENGRRWMIAPAIVDGLVLSGAVVVALGASWLAARGVTVDRSIWRRGALLAGASPQAVGGVIAVAVLIGVSAQLVGPLMIVILSAPFAVFVAATFRWISTTHRMDVDA